MAFIFGTVPLQPIGSLQGVRRFVGRRGQGHSVPNDNRDEAGYSTVSSQVLTFDVMALVVVGRDRAQWA